MDLKKHSGIVAILFFAFAVIGIQIWSTASNTAQIEKTITELKSIQDSQLSNEKSRQEVIALRIKNETESLFWSRLLGIIGPMFTGLVALLTALVGLRNYLGSREKERLDRAASDLQEMLKQIADKEPRVRAMGIVGLQHFFLKDKEEYYLRALSALVAAARLEDDVEVLRCIRIVAERALDELPAAVLKQVSWQHVNLKGADLAGHDISALDLRDAVLEDANLTRCNLTGARLTNARLNGATLDEAVLAQARCEYADFAGASLQNTCLQRAWLDHIKVQNMNLAGADLREAKYHVHDVAWEKIKNWRKATFDEGILGDLLERLGPDASGVHVLMLMWEIPPFVAGGTWTACYHMIRNVRRRGAKVTVVVPWDTTEILSSPFGCEVDIVALGIRLSDPSISSYESGPSRGPWWSGYASAQPYGSPYSYASAKPYGSPYGYASTGGPFCGYPPPYSPYAAYGSTNPQPYNVYSTPPGGMSPDELRRQPLVRSSILALSEAFKKRLERFAELDSFDIIHAQDWITFSAAGALSKKTAKPWIAHFHSTEFERRADSQDILIQQIEYEAVRNADRLITPSRTTADVLVEHYQASEEKITIAPNVLSDEDTAYPDTGSFESQRVIFVGRFASQKGPDRFAAIARMIHQSKPDVQFWAFGDGEQEAASQLLSGGVQLKGFLPWEQRHAAFRGATVLIVPSRAEPFGMVVLESMLYGVPVFYPDSAGVAEVIRSGFKIDPAGTSVVAHQVLDVLSHWTRWADTVKQQSAEIEDYASRAYELKLIEVWKQFSCQTTKT